MDDKDVMEHPAAPRIRYLEAENTRLTNEIARMDILEAENKRLTDELAIATSLHETEQGIAKTAQKIAVTATVQVATLRKRLAEICAVQDARQPVGLDRMLCQERGHDPDPRDDKTCRCCTRLFYEESGTPDGDTTDLEAAMGHAHEALERFEATKAPAPWAVKHEGFDSVVDANDHVVFNEILGLVSAIEFAVAAATDVPALCEAVFAMYRRIRTEAQIGWEAACQHWRVVETHDRARELIEAILKDLTIEGHYQPNDVLGAMLALRDALDRRPRMTVPSSY